MSMNKLVSIKVPVLNAIEDMGLDIAKDVPTFTRWAADAEKQIGSYYSFVRKIDVITAKNCTVNLPCDCSHVQYVILGDYGCDCSDLFSRCYVASTSIGASTTDTFLIIDKPETGNVVLGGLLWEVQNGQIVFNKDYNNQKVTVQYLGFKTDEDGFPLVGENHVEAIVTYIMYKFARRSRFSPIKMDHMDVRELWREWNRLASNSRADDGEITDVDRQQIVGMISDPFIGYGLDASNNMGDYNY